MDQQENKLSAFDGTVIKVWAVSLGIVIALSWKLWFPGFANFPRVPLIGVLDGSILIALHYVAAIGLVVSLAAIGFGLSNLQRWSGATAFAFGILFLCNQHCLQPWAWQGFIIAVLLACLPMMESKKWIARVLISIYLYSAIGKFDYQFVHSLGQEFLNTVLDWFGSADTVSQQLKSKLVLLFPIGELLIAIGLMIPQTRKPAAWLAIALHLMLIGILSPLGLGHRWPVVIWNAMSILFVIWLFLNSKETGRAQGRATLVAQAGMLFAIIVLAGPLLRPVQLWDHWLAWGLYSPSNSRVEISISDTARGRISEGLLKYLPDEDGSFGSSRFAIDRWSLDELGVPIYPQARFQKSAAIEWIRSNELGRHATVIELSSSHPATGERQETRVDLK